MLNVPRVPDYQHLQEDDLVKPTSARVFFDPADTETGIWAARDLITQGCGVLDLGSGSGAAAAAMARAGARVHGVDHGPETVAWASEHYTSQEGRSKVTFACGDFSVLSAEELLATAPNLLPRPLIITSNPPYVPFSAQVGEPLSSIGGGTDGLNLVPAIIEHCRSLRSGLALTIGSYSTPRKAVRMLEAAGLRICAITLCSLPLSQFTLRNIRQVLALEDEGEAILWRTGPHEQPAYFVIGLACRWSGETGTRDDVRHRAHSAVRGLMRLLKAAAASRTPRLEALDGARLGGWPGSLRVLDLPDCVDRHQW
ncbi:methyltransferase domain-containing protein [Streptomyces sp. NPDC019443]|uniref:methyltransferase domain-containing protein n=1 Tax=Streptomyces sp. NPDC019443 TaxID=3365061 RepID=UPI0037ADAADA